MIMENVDGIDVDGIRIAKSEMRLGILLKYGDD